MNEVIITIITALLTGGFSSLITVRFSRQKAKAEAVLAESSVKTSELDNVQEAVKIWREMAESLKSELNQSRDDYKNITSEIESLRKEIAHLTCINSKIMKLLDKITPENLEKMVEQIKKEIHETGN